MPASYHSKFDQHWLNMALLAHQRLRQACRPVSRASPSSRKPALRVVAFKESTEVHDWRTKKMMDTAHSFYVDVLSKGSMDAADRVLDTGLVFRDEVSGKLPLVGLKAFKEHLSETRLESPDMWFEIEQFGLQDTTHMFVQWTCHSTQLESLHGPPSYHTSVIKGVDILAFNSERTQVVEVEQFRQPTAEERPSHHEEHSTTEIKLARLHWEKPDA